MNFKRIVLTIFTIFLILGWAMPSFAEPNISEDKAMKIGENAFKNYLSVELDDKFQSRIDLRYEEDEEEAVWNTHCYKYEDDIDIEMYAQIDSNNGKILELRYHNWNNKYNSSIPIMTKKEAKKIADDFLKKINPVENTKLRLRYDYHLSEVYRRETYNFNFVRQENGIDFSQDYIDIEVNGVTGRIEYYRFNWDDEIKFDENKDIISKENAKKILKDNTNMKLVYSDIDANADNKPKSIEAYYKPYNENGFLVDAKSGVMLKEDDLNYKDIKDTEKEQIYKNSTKSENHKTELIEKEAKDKICSIANDLIKDDFEIRFLRYEKDGYYSITRGRKVWEANIGIEGRNRDVNISIDAITGEIISFGSYYFNGESDESTPKINWSEGYGKAIDFLSKYYGHNIKELDTKVLEKSSYYYANGKKMNLASYSYKFSRVKDEINYKNNYISIVIDSTTGDVAELKYVWDNNVKFTQSDKVIDKDKVKNIYFDNHKVELVYTIISNKNENDKKAILVYTLEDVYGFNKIDAISGKVLDYNGEEFQRKDTKDYSYKIKGHWAEKELTILSDTYIIDLKTFEPNNDISKIEAIKMIVNGRGYSAYRIGDANDLKFKDIKNDDEDISYIKAAVNCGFVENEEENFNKDAKVTRQEMAEMLVKLLNKEELAKMKGVYSPEFNDGSSIDENYKGYVSICKSLEIINGDNSSFRPKNNATMIEMAISIYKALSKVKMKY